MKYGNKSVDLGNELTPTETRQIPEIHYKHEGGVLYTLVMTGKLDRYNSKNNFLNLVLLLFNEFKVYLKFKISKNMMLYTYIDTTLLYPSGIHDVCNSTW